VISSLLIAGRCGSAMGAELGTMRVTEQIDALEVLATDPVHYLMVPRVWATVLIYRIARGPGAISLDHLFTRRHAR